MNRSRTTIFIMLALIASCGAGHAAGVDGLNIHTLDYQGAEDAGRFVYTGKGEVAWTQYGGIGPVHAYSELSREPGRITIEDSIHDRKLVLDLARKQVFRLWRDGKQVALYSIVDFEGGDLAAAAASVPACGGLALRPCSDGESPAPCASGLVVNYAMKKCMRSSLENARQAAKPLALVYPDLQPGNPQHEQLLARRLDLKITNLAGDPWARVSARGSDTVLEVKRRAASAKNEKADSFDLFLVLTGDHPLDDSATLAQYDISNSSDLSVSGKPCYGPDCKIMLFVYPRGESFTGMYVKNDATVLSIKERLRKKSRRPPEHIELDFEGTVMADDRTLYSYGISNATSTTVGMRYTAAASDMFILHIRQPDGAVLTLDQQPNYTYVREVKAEYERLTGVPAARQMLYFNGQPLNQQYLGLGVPVREGDTLDMVVK